MISYRVREEARRMGLTPSALLRRAGISATVAMKMLHNSANGKPDGPALTSIHVPSLLALARATGKDPLELLEYHDN